MKLSLLHIVSLFVCCFLATAGGYARCTTIVVDSQSSFDELQERLINTLNAGEKDICVSFSPGEYIAKQRHIKLTGINAPGTRLRIKGNGATFIPRGFEYHDGDVYQGTFSIDNSWMSGTKDVETWSSVKYADGLIEVVDSLTKRCRIKCGEAFPNNTDFSNAYILIPHWYLSSVYKVDKIEGRYIYFVADDLKPSLYGGYNVNDDYNYGKKEIRYKLCNIKTNEDCFRIDGGIVHLPGGVSSVWEGVIRNFITIKDCRFSSVEIVDVQFLGNAYSKPSAAVVIVDTECQRVNIQRCVFRGMRGNAVSVNGSPNVTISNCKFEDCHYYGLYSDNGSANTVVECSSFTSMGKRMRNARCIKCMGTNHRISDNVFLDFGYGGISSGVGYNVKMKQPCSGVIENNDMSFTQDYLDHIENNCVMDGGAIYIAPQNVGTIVRYNHIHGFSGIKSNRGIFCDDGASGFELYGNVITGIANSWCIDSRRVAQSEIANNPKSKMERANVNIVIHDNIVDGGIRFVANEDSDNGCFKGANYILHSENGELPKIKVENVVNAEDDILLEYTGEKNGKIVLPAKSYSKLKRNKNWKFVRGLFVK